ncbi:hypothetical protein ACFLTZ_04300 [Chloroflexota bacterium]
MIPDYSSQVMALRKARFYSSTLYVEGLTDETSHAATKLQAIVLRLLVP